jgi:hypothetical protein
MTVLSGVVDRTEHTRGITESRQESSIRPGTFKSIFADGRRTRSLGEIDTIVLHQTWYWQTLRGNDVTAYDHTIAHFVVLPKGGEIIQLRDIDVRLNNVLPTHGVHIEIVGCFNSDSFDCHAYRRNEAAGLLYTGGRLHATLRSRAEVPRVRQIQATRRLIAALVSHDPIMGQINCILAHRQVTSMGSGRANCPGPHIWYNVGEWARREWHLDSGCHRAQTIPVSWQNPRFTIPLPCPPIPEEERAARGRVAPRREGVRSFAYRDRTTTGLT